MKIANKPYFLMIVGLPGSGKSTYIKNHFDDPIRVHSSDAIREELSGDANNQDINAKVFELLHSRVKEDLKNGISCVYDATNISWKKRKAFLDSINNISCYKICYVIATPYDICLEQNCTRDRVVPEQVIKRMYMNFDIPWYNEGWNDIRIVYNQDSYSSYYNHWWYFLDRHLDFDQESKWHTETLGIHCNRCAEFVLNNMKDLIDRNAKETLVAAALHDCGKPFTKTFIDSKGEKSDFAHYYNHENVGSYNSLFYKKDNDTDSLLVAALIRWHMVLHFFKDWKPKTIEKYEKEFTSNLLLQHIDFYKALKLLHEGDKAAH
jgi:predicted kinase